MEKGKICVNKTVAILGVVVLLILSYVGLTNYISNTSVKTNSRAAANNMPIPCWGDECNTKTPKPTPTIDDSQWYKCDENRPCSSDKYCFNHQGDTTECVDDIKYWVWITTPETFFFYGGKPYRSYDAQNPLYEYTNYGQQKSASLNLNREYALIIHDQYPGEWWRNYMDVKVTVTGVKNKLVKLDQGNSQRVGDQNR